MELHDEGPILGIGDLFFFEGRITRGTFWKIVLLLVLSLILMFSLVWGAGKLRRQYGGDMEKPVEQVVFVFGMSLIGWVNLATQVKRWHDLGLSGWLVLINMIPLAGIIAILYLGVAPGMDEPNRYGPAPARLYLTRFRGADGGQE